MSRPPVLRASLPAVPQLVGPAESPASLRLCLLRDREFYFACLLAQLCEHGVACTLAPRQLLARAHAATTLEEVAGPPDKQIFEYSTSQTERRLALLNQQIASHLRRKGSPETKTGGSWTWATDVATGNEDQPRRWVELAHLVVLDQASPSVDKFEAYMGCLLVFPFNGFGGFTRLRLLRDGENLLEVQIAWEPAPSMCDRHVYPTGISVHPQRDPDWEAPGLSQPEVRMQILAPCVRLKAVDSQLGEQVDENVLSYAVVDSDTALPPEVACTTPLFRVNLLETLPGAESSRPVDWARRLGLPRCDNGTAALTHLGRPKFTVVEARSSCDLALAVPPAPTTPTECGVADLCALRTWFEVDEHVPAAARREILVHNLLFACSLRVLAPSEYAMRLRALLDGHVRRLARRLSCSADFLPLLAAADAAASPVSSVGAVEDPVVALDVSAYACTMFYFCDVLLRFSDAGVVVPLVGSVRLLELDTPKEGLVQHLGKDSLWHSEAQAARAGRLPALIPLLDLDRTPELRDSASFAEYGKVFRDAVLPRVLAPGLQAPLFRTSHWEAPPYRPLSLPAVEHAVDLFDDYWRYESAYQNVPAPGPSVSQDSTVLRYLLGGRSLPPNVRQRAVVHAVLQCVQDSLAWGAELLPDNPPEFDPDEWVALRDIKTTELVLMRRVDAGGALIKRREESELAAKMAALVLAAPPAAASAPPPPGEPAYMEPTHEYYTHDAKLLAVTRFRGRLRGGEVIGGDDFVVYRLLEVDPRAWPAPRTWLEAWFQGYSQSVLPSRRAGSLRQLITKMTRIPEADVARGLSAHLRLMFEHGREQLAEIFSLTTLPPWVRQSDRKVMLGCGAGAVRRLGRLRRKPAPPGSSENPEKAALTQEDVRFPVEVHAVLAAAFHLHLTEDESVADYLALPEPVFFEVEEVCANLGPAEERTARALRLSRGGFLPHLLLAVYVALLAAQSGAIVLDGQLFLSFVSALWREVESTILRPATGTPARGQFPWNSTPGRRTNYLTTGHHLDDLPAELACWFHFLFHVRHVEGVPVAIPSPRAGHTPQWTRFGLLGTGGGTVCPVGPSGLWLSGDVASSSPRASRPQLACLLPLLPEQEVHLSASANWATGLGRERGVQTVVSVMPRGPPPIHVADRLDLLRLQNSGRRVRAPGLPDHDMVEPKVLLRSYLKAGLFFKGAWKGDKLPGSVQFGGDFPNSLIVFDSTSGGQYPSEVPVTNSQNKAALQAWMQADSGSWTSAPVEPPRLYFGQDPTTRALKPPESVNVLLLLFWDPHMIQTYSNTGMVWRATFDRDDRWYYRRTAPTHRARVDAYIAAGMSGPAPERDEVNAGPFTLSEALRLAVGDYGPAHYLLGVYRRQARS